ncbi:MAG: hypothetical protein CMH31_05370 [Micavibrio sp.]|nr:hypothetical protein [Micavibrio sp.]|tara:strand:- start:1951 stop:2673 length:723 start_codon:yes stop_codon:yes gene_type:complete
MSLWYNTIKPALRKMGIQKPYHRLKKRLEAEKLKGQKHEEVFGQIYESNDWNGRESVSGQGSDLNETEVLLQKLPALLEKYDVKTIIDLPCGDFNWIQHLEYDFDHYTGVDIVQAIIDRNICEYGSDSISFKKQDCLKDDLGRANLILCRDLLIHFSFEDCFSFFKNLKKSNIQYVLTTHFIDEENEEIETGQWHPINLMAPPFNLSEPLDMIIEETKMFDGRYAQTKTMSLWKVSDLPF